MNNDLVKLTAYPSYLKDNAGNYILNDEGKQIMTSISFVDNGSRYIVNILRQVRQVRDKQTGKVHSTVYYDVYKSKAKESNQ